MSSSDSNSPPPPKLRNISGEASQTLQGMAGIGRGGVRLAARTGGQADEPGIREIMKGDHPKLADIGECLRDLSPGQKSKALKNYLSIAPRCESPTFLEHELKEIYDNKEKWVDFEGKKIRANETLLAFQGASQLRYEEDFKKMEKEMKKLHTSKAGAGTSRPSGNLAGKPSLQNIQGRDWILPNGGPEGNLGEIISGKFVSIYRENQTVQDSLTKTVKAILGELNTGGWTLTEGGKSRQSKYQVLDARWVTFFCDFVANLFGTGGQEREVFLERCRHELKYQLELSRRGRRESTGSGTGSQS